MLKPANAACLQIWGLESSFVTKGINGFTVSDMVRKNGSSCFACLESQKDHVTAVCSHIIWLVLSQFPILHHNWKTNSQLYYCQLKYAFGLFFPHSCSLPLLLVSPWRRLWWANYFRYLQQLSSAGNAHDWVLRFLSGLRGSSFVWEVMIVSIRLDLSKWGLRDSRESNMQSLR